MAHPFRVFCLVVYFRGTPGYWARLATCEPRTLNWFVFGRALLDVAAGGLAFLPACARLRVNGSRSRLSRTRSRQSRRSHRP
ncbi:hypothetical protein CENDO_06765 [Corynebacterium endometrii]|uniref:Uncharacterized protein n=1 Tax=Corynebacterium endometrii TaxID=2488819 RepID=A0A4P7QII8_9CORY|nr:hypothetical protein CENDO_06765 [Corynebacterium endometrii]